MKGYFRRLFVVAAATAIVAAACGEAADDVPATSGPVTTSPVTTSPVTTSPPGSDSDALAGSSWVVVGMRSASGPIDIVAGSEPTVAFDGDASTISGSTGCNLFSGSVTVGSGSIAIGNMAVTERGCIPAEIMEMESQFVAILSGVTTFTLEGGELRFEGVVGSLSLEAPAPVVDLPLDGTRWALDTLNDGLAATSVLATTSPGLRFDGGTITGTTGCNDLGARLVVDGDRISIEDLFFTEIACEPDVMDQEAFILDVLGAADRLEIAGDRLTIFAGGRSLGLRGA